MNKHFLVTVSEQRSTLYGVKYIGHFFSHKADIKITLFYTAPRPADAGGGESTLEAKLRKEKQSVEYLTRGKQALDIAEEELIQLGFVPELIETKLQSRKISKIDDIIHEGAEGQYDAVILGKRGLSWLEESFDESVTKGFLENRCHFPVWFCRLPDLERKNILVAVDGSEASNRMVDHIGFVLSNERSHEITLLTVNKGNSTTREINEIFDKNKALLSKNGFPLEIVKTRVVESNNVAKTILEEVDKNRFSTVAVGRTGTGQGLLKKLFMGSVSESVFKSLNNAALWLCY